MIQTDYVWRFLSYSQGEACQSCERAEPRAQVGHGGDEESGVVGVGDCLVIINQMDALEGMQLKMEDAACSVCLLDAVMASVSPVLYTTM